MGKSPKSIMFGVEEIYGQNTFFIKDGNFKISKRGKELSKLQKMERPL